MSQGPTNPTPDLVEALAHHRMSQTLILRLFNVLQHCPPTSTNQEIEDLIAPLRAALTFTGTPDQALAKHLDALKAGSTPANILQCLEQDPSKNPELEQAVLRYAAILEEIDDLPALIQAHRLAQELAQSDPYHFEVDPEVRSGDPCFQDQRISVYDVLEYLASGMTAEEIVYDFPDLTSQDINTCLTFTAELLRRANTPNLE